jgi:hypothetical protein
MADYEQRIESKYTEIEPGHYTSSPHGELTFEDLPSELRDKINALPNAEKMRLLSLRPAGTSCETGEQKFRAKFLDQDRTVVRATICRGKSE